MSAFLLGLSAFGGLLSSWWLVSALLPPKSSTDRDDAQAALGFLAVSAALFFATLIGRAFA